MNEKKPRDRIDIELSKTYFGNPSRDSRRWREAAKHHPGRENAPKPRRKRIRFNRLTFSKFLFMGLVVLGALVFLSIYLVGYENVVSVLKTKTGFIPASQRPIIWSEGKIKKAVPAAPSVKHAFRTEKNLYDFEKDENNWEIPGWELDKPDHVARSLKKVRGVASKGTGSLELYVEFPGNNWSGALTEIQHYLDLGNYDAIYADVYLPPEAPKGLRGKLILTVGEDWRFVEMARGFHLEPGEWTTITADISEESTDWKRTKVDDTFKTDVRKIAIRIESNKDQYFGPIYIDNIRVYSH
jgi:hypothetical protein